GDGALHVIENVGTCDLVLAHEHAASSAANRFDFGGASVVLSKGSALLVKYDGTASRWRTQSGFENTRQRVGARRQPVISNDFADAAHAYPFYSAVISSGTAASSALYADSNHPGTALISSSATANSGAYFTTEATIRLGGGEQFEAVIMPLSATGKLMRIGFHDTATSADATDGAYVEIDSSGNAILKTANNATRAGSLATTLLGTMTASTWYRIVITLNRDATAVTGELFDMTGLLIGSQTLTTNIPTASGRETAARLIATNSVAAAASIVAVDYMAVLFGTSRPLNR
ncbi:MAG: hypothetical protein U1E15_10950, partial [Hyphomicrobiales bacterium]